MAWIKEVDRKECMDLNAIYERAEKRTSKEVANILKVHSVNPSILELHMRLYERVLFGPSPLTFADRELIGVIVSKNNECSYCITHYSEALIHVTNDENLVKKVLQNFYDANLTKPQIAMCEYVTKLTKTPFKMTEDDVIHLRDNGFSDEEIFDINQTCAYFNYVNRIVSGLGVELED